MDFKQHWENIYTNNELGSASWFQPTPQASLDFINEMKIPKDAAILDVGGGDSYLVDNLLKNGYTDITVLDISEAAIKKAQNRLGKNAENINWIVSDITELSTSKKFDFWHDRATFHFLTTEKQVNQYLSVAEKHIATDGRMMVGTFSAEGPDKCSGLPVKQYSEQSLTQLLKKWFQKIKCITVDHLTPFNTKQNFLFCGFSKINL